MARRSVLVSYRSMASLTLLMSAFALLAGCGRTAESSEAKALRSRANSLTSLPHVTIVALSDWQGVIKPCGCVEELQRGGIERTAAWLKRLRKSDDSVVVVHAGALLAEDEHAKPGQAAQRRERMAAFAKMIDKLGVDAISVSRDDLLRGGAVARHAIQNGRFPVIATGWKSSISRAISRRVIKTRSGVRVGVFALSARAGATAQLKVVAAKEVKALRAQGAQVIVALSDLSMRASRRIVRAVDGVDVLLLGRVPPKTEPVEEGEIDGGAWVLMPPRHGAYMAKLTLSLNGTGPWLDASAWMPGAEAVAKKRTRRLSADLKRWSGPGQSVATKRSLPF
ncbi:MAG: hypothetical protein CMH53_08605, partial [Myxococcales bacterium]|nr:hypothetical protein [Myxococcales bacterium]